MPFPLSKVRTLSDYEGMFVLSVCCKACKHERAIPAKSLANRVGTNARVADVVKRMRCSQCNSRQVEAAVVGIPR
jgi:hypothetical protein